MIGMNLLILAFLAFTSVAEADEFNPIELLNKNIDMATEKIEIVISKDKIVYKFCPDNTCERIEFSSEVNRTTADELVFLYYSLVPGYIYLDKFKKKDLEIVRTLVKKYSERCNKGEKEGPCALRKLSEQTSPMLFGERFEEGQHCVAPLELLDTYIGIKTVKESKTVCSANERPTNTRTK
jgi:hypothetical protein